MKFSLIFLLLTPVIMSQQQHHRAMLQYLPYFQQQEAYNNYQSQPYYNDLPEDVSYLRNFGLTAPVINSH